MTDPRLDNLAKILVLFSTRVKPGDFVWIQAEAAAMPLVTAVYRQVLEAGGNPSVNLNHDDWREALLRQGRDEQLDWISPVDTLLVEQADVRIYLDASFNTRSMSGVDPLRNQYRTRAFAGLVKTLFRRMDDGSLRWVITQHPTQALAQDADMSLSEFEDFVFQACAADRPDPVAFWEQTQADQQRLVDWLQGRREISVRGPNVDLTLQVEGRSFINSSGQVNIPDGEVFTSPVEDSARGWVRFTYPAIYNAREVDGVELEFEAGKVAAARASKNEAFLLSVLDTDSGARFLGEFAIGTNYGIDRFTRSILYDEKIGGSFHLALGAGFGECGGKNESSVHWDLISDLRDGSEIRADGELFYKDGIFTI